MIVTLATQNQWIIHQLDVKSAFLNGFLEEEIYIEQPQEFVASGGDKSMLLDFKNKMKKVFEMSDLGNMNYFLRMEVMQTEKGIFLSQRSFAVKVLDKFSMKNCKPTSTPMAVGMKLSRQESGEPVCETIYKSLIGSLLYFTATRLDIMFSVSVLSRFMNCCNDQHFQTAKRVLRYIKGTIGHGVLFKRVENMKLTGYVDSDWAGSCDDMRSTSGYAFSLGSGMFCWSSKKQSLMAQSTAEAKFIAAATANPVFHGRTKHFNIKLHVIREMEQAHEIELVHCNSEEQITEIFTKALNMSSDEDSTSNFESDEDYLSNYVVFTTNVTIGSDDGDTKIEYEGD
ncbi:uncharacterized mitochondrial protein AtMg00810-like [Gossypium hirsutum]|uniref:Uncharacterized mitochondrial protein AtMg00810-like n=1 Tax=Gossypium hirsutum TaxID=3635 RepID=A0A1U8M7N6_GOSHI|nr:uncharacterized mitochondrial protein AtMg00810-like [Gossypium hirsutum]